MSIRISVRYYFIKWLLKSVSKYKLHRFKSSNNCALVYQKMHSLGKNIIEWDKVHGPNVSIQSIQKQDRERNNLLPRNFSNCLQKIAFLCCAIFHSSEGASKQSQFQIFCTYASFVHFPINMTNLLGNLKLSFIIFENTSLSKV